MRLFYHENDRLAMPICRGGAYELYCRTGLAPAKIMGIHGLRWRILRCIWSYRPPHIKKEYHPMRGIPFWLITVIMIQKSIGIKRTIPLQMYAIEYADPQFFLTWNGIKCDFRIGVKDYFPTIWFGSITNVFRFWLFNRFAFTPALIGFKIMDVCRSPFVVNI